ncbi:MAG TPA: DUF3325 domain-containing protein [Steroidobacteraceae bacterium]|jgi:hypothetical protein
MSAVAFALIYTGLALLSLAMNRHAREILQREPSGTQRFYLRVMGWGALLISLLLAIYRSGWPIGAVEWVGMLTAGGLSLVFLLTYSPRIAGALALGLPILTIAASLAQ